MHMTVGMVIFRKKINKMKCLAKLYYDDVEEEDKDMIHTSCNCTDKS